jgi:hypothetical protein
MVTAAISVKMRMTVMARAASGNVDGNEDGGRDESDDTGVGGDGDCNKEGGHGVDDGDHNDDGERDMACDDTDGDINNECTGQAKCWVRA